MDLIQAMNLLDNTIEEVSSQEMADPITLSSRIFSALASLERLVSNGKLSLSRTQRHAKKSRDPKNK